MTTQPNLGGIGFRFGQPVITKDALAGKRQSGGLQLADRPGNVGSGTFKFDKLEGKEETGV